ncbi:MAG: glycosyltransferase family 9 protein [Lentimicrobium sp.]
MPKKILIIRFSSIGDIVLTSPVIRCLHEQIKDVEIHYLAKRKFSAIVENNPYITKVYAIDKDVSEVISRLKAESYDHIVDLHKNLRSFQVILRLMKPYSNFKKLNLRKWVFVRFKASVMPPLHIVDRYMEAVKKLGVNNDGEGLGFFIPPGEEVDRSSLPVPFKSGFIGIVIGGKHNTKILPVDKVTEICIGLKRPVILLGGPEDAARGDAISAACGKEVMNACGKYSLMQSASLVKQADFIITNDTGMMHIAAAFRKSTISVWGNTLPELGMYPYLPAEVPHLVSEVKGLGCRPCSKIGFEKCPKGHFRCMREQDTDAIVRFVYANSAK